MVRTRLDRASGLQRGVASVIPSVVRGAGWLSVRLAALLAGGMLAAAPVAADPAMPVPDPDVNADLDYFDYLERQGYLGDRYLARVLGIGICNFLNSPTATADEVKTHLSKNPVWAQAQLTGAAIFYCPWNLDKVAN